MVEWSVLGPTGLIVECKQSLFCLRIHGEEHKKLSEHDIWWTSRVIERQCRNQHSTSNILCSSRWILEQKRDCSQSRLIASCRLLMTALIIIITGEPYHDDLNVKFQGLLNICWAAFILFSGVVGLQNSNRHQVKKCERNNEMLLHCSYPLDIMFPQSQILVLRLTVQAKHE